jgi:hypothetical protein
VLDIREVRMQPMRLSLRAAIALALLYLAFLAFAPWSSRADPVARPFAVSGNLPTL